MTEPGTGSDLASIATTAARDGDEYVVNGAKTFITNGINSDLVITVCRTGEGRSGLSLIVLERCMEGFERGRNLDKIGQHSADNAELFFSDVRVPVRNRLGDSQSAQDEGEVGGLSGGSEAVSADGGATMASLVDTGDGESVGDQQLGDRAEIVDVVREAVDEHHPGGPRRR